MLHFSDPANALFPNLTNKPTKALRLIFPFFQMHPKREIALALQDEFKVCLVCIEFGCLENKHACKSQILSRSCQNPGQIFWPPTLQWISMQLADPPAAWNTFRRQRNKIFRRNLQLSQLLVELPHVAGTGGGFSMKNSSKLSLL